MLTPEQKILLREKKPSLKAVIPDGVKVSKMRTDEDKTLISMIAKTYVKFILS